MDGPAWCPCWLQGRADHLRLGQPPSPCPSVDFPPQPWLRCSQPQALQKPLGKPTPQANNPPNYLLPSLLLAKRLTRVSYSSSQGVPGKAALQEQELELR